MSKMCWHLTQQLGKRRLRPGIQQALESWRDVADQADFDGKTYRKTEVMAALSTLLLATFTT